MPDIFFGWRMEEAEVEMEMVVEREVSLCNVFVDYVLSFSILFLIVVFFVCCSLIVL